MARMSESGEPIEPVYRPKDLADFDPGRHLCEPGSFPFTRGVHPGMYTARAWTMRQYAGLSTAAGSNRRYAQLIAAGGTGLSVAFDLPTQMGYDSDAPAARGEVGKVGVAIDSIEDMRELFRGIPLGQVSTSMTINAPAAVLLLLYELVAAEQGVAPAELAGTIQNDILKEYIARGTYIFPPVPGAARGGRRRGGAEPESPRAPRGGHGGQRDGDIPGVPLPRLPEHLQRSPLARQLAGAGRASQQREQPAQAGAARHLTGRDVAHLSTSRAAGTPAGDHHPAAEASACTAGSPASARRPR